MEKRVNFSFDLPMLLINNILVVSPIKTLLRFRCVCKEWYSLINEPSFISNHNIAYKSDTVKYLIHETTGRTIHDAHAHIERLYYWNKSLPLGKDRDVEELGSKTDWLEFHGSCNGLVCFSVYSEDDHNENFSLSNPIYLWNPSIKKYKVVHHDKNHTQHHDYGFVDYFLQVGSCTRDNDIDDYKIVKFLIGADGEGVYDTEHCFLDVYTLRTDSWKGFVEIDYRLWCRGLSKTVNEAMHWVSTGKEGELVLGEIAFPNAGYSMQEAHWSLGDISGLLCSVASFNSKLHIWIMGEYGVAESWTLFKIISMESIRLSPILLWNQGLFANSFEGDLSMFDLEDNKWISIEESNSPDRISYNIVTDYDETLVLLNEK